jgi:1,2-diacylglycerol 3-beta-glucosyltransferase
MKILSFALFPVLFLYAGLLWYLLWAVIKPRRRHAETREQNDPLPGVSIVIPFRNEASHLRRLIESLESQTYKGDFEILLVNDGSTDDFREVLSGIPSPHQARVLDSVFAPDRGLTSKQQALDLGIRDAAYDRIALTDADMLLNPDWLQTLVGHSLRGADLVFGHTAMSTGPSSNLFTRFQAFQLETLFAFAYAFNRGGVMGSCMGNNLMVSRQAYAQVGGFDAMGYSLTEDRELLSFFWKKKLRVAATEPFYFSAVTFPTPNARGYFHQLLRWAYGGLRPDSNLSLFALLGGGQNIALLLSIAGRLSPTMAFFALCNVGLTWFFVAVAFKKMRSKENALLFAPFSILLLGETLALVAAFIFRRPVKWKDRRM